MKLLQFDNSKGNIDESTSNDKRILMKASTSNSKMEFWKQLQQMTNWNFENNYGKG